MDDRELEAIEGRWQESTQGEWEATTTTPFGPSSGVRYSVKTPDGSITGWGRVTQTKPDATFIAHAHQDIPKLIAALRAERARLQEVRRMFSEWDAADRIPRNRDNWFVEEWSTELDARLKAIEAIVRKEPPTPQG